MKFELKGWFRWFSLKKFATVGNYSILVAKTKQKSYLTAPKSTAKNAGGADFLMLLIEPKPLRPLAPNPSPYHE